MSIWILHLKLTPEEEMQIQQRSDLPLPFDYMPDLSMVSSQVECRHLIKALYPDDPPETITRKVNRVWNIFSSLHIEDVIAVPLQHAKEMAFAEVTGRYRYQVGEEGGDVHLIPVKWFSKKASIRSFGKHKELFNVSGEAMREITNQESRIALRDKLPYKYNRFAKWKWLLVIFLIVGSLRACDHLLHR